MEPDHLCRATNRQGNPCSQDAGYGTSHPGEGRCKFHGGASPQAELAGVITLARREAATMGRPLDIDPHEAILECIRISAGEVAYASEQIACLEHEHAVGGVTTVKTRPLKGEYGEETADVMVTETTRDMGALNVWIAVRHKAMDRLVEYSKVALHAGVEERHVRLAEQQGQLMASAIRNILAALGVADHPDAGRVVRRELEVIAGGAAAA